MSATITTLPTNAPPRFRLRGDLRVTASEGSFVLEDPSRGQFFRVGPAEYAVIAQLDGQRDLRDVIQKNESLAGLQTWLLASGLIEPACEEDRHRVANTPRTPKQTRFNPCYFRLSLGAPTQLLSVLEQCFGWLFSLPALLIVALFSLGAAFVVVEHWKTLGESLSRVLCPDQHLALFGCWLVLKLAHEIGHGVACKRLGGDVREWGLAFIYLMPVPYTDVTSSWRLRSRFDRIAVAAAGMYVEWIFALLALLVWNYVESPAVRQLCVYTISLATLSTVLFNANPLCRLDGYYILSDLLKWPNLSAQGQRVASSWFSQLWGEKGTSEASLTGNRYWLALAYGIASAVWQKLALLTMAIVVFLAYEGLGILLIAGVLLTWYQPFASGTKSSSAARLQWAKQMAWRIPRLALLVGIVGFGLCFFRWPIPMTAPGIVESSEQHAVRARVSGQVTELFVTDGQWVEEGQKLAVVSNDALELELKNLELSLAQGEAQLRSLYTKRQLADYQIQQQRQEVLTKQIDEQRSKLETLTLRAPAAGRVAARRLADLPGSFVKEGAEVCTIISAGFQFRFSFAQNELPYFSQHVDEQPIQVHLQDRTIRGTIIALEPQASKALFDASLGAAAGGPLPVTSSTSGDGKDSAQSWILVEPRVTGTIAISENDWKWLRVGERGSVALYPQHVSLANVIANSCQDWFHRLRDRANPSNPQR